MMNKEKVPQQEVGENKRASVVFANHYLITHGMGVLVIPEKNVPEFKKLLIAYYKGKL